MDYSITYHTAFSSVLDSLWQHSDQSRLYQNFFEKHGFSQLPEWQGIGTSTMQRLAYESAVISNVFPEMEPKLLEQISRIYQQLGIYNAIREKLLSRLYNIDSDIKLVDVLLILEIACGETFGFEKQLAADCQSTLDLIRETTDTKLRPSD